MKKYISCLLTLALFIPALVSCTRELKDDISQNNTHLVHFSTSNPETKTGLKIENGIAYPDWRETKLENIHFFEMSVNGGEPSYGEALSIDESEDYTTAHFTASFTEDMTIHVDPPTRAGDSDMYYYGAVVAQKPNEDDLTFVIPAEQKPDAATLKDPDADFLVGYSRKACEAYVDDENVVDLYFDRVAALGRLSFTHFKTAGEKVKSVTINSTNGLVGSAAYSDITFGEKNTVTFTRAAGPLTLSFGDGRAVPTEGAFEAYFVVIPGEATITSIEVLTDKYHYTKAIDGGKAFTFSNEAFKNINMDLDTADAEEVSAVWYKASMLEDGIEYLIVSQGYALKNNNGSTAGVSVTDNDGVITLEAADPTIVWTSTAKTYTTGDNGEGGIVAGHFTLTNNGYYLRRQSNTDILLDTTVPSDKPKYVVWDYDGSYLHQESSETATFFCFYNNGWSTGYTSNGAAPGSDIKTVQIYTNRAPQVLSFDPAASAEYDLAVPGWTVAVPTLKGAQTSVTYALSEDSNPAVATVDADGTVHPLSRGTVTVVATAAGNAQYQAASATYTLRVIDSSVTINTYIKVTSTSDLEAGAQYLLVFEGLAGDTDGDGNPKVFKPILDGNTFSKTTGNALDVEIESATISSNEFEEYHLTLEAGYYLKANNVNRYIYPSGSSSGSGTLSAESTPSTALSISFSSGIVQIKANSGTNYLVWSTSSHYFSSNSSLSGQYSTGICLYKLDDGRLPQSPSFSPSEVNYDMAGSAALVKPTLSNAFGTVTYSSSNEEIASVDAESGNVTVHGRGSVEITATAAGNSQYKPGSASYTLNISNSNVQTIRFVLANSIEAGNNYLVVSGGQALKNNGGNVASEAVTASAGVIEIEVGQETNLLWAATAESGFTSNGHFSLSNGGYRMNRVSNSGNFSLSLVASTTAMDKYGVWDLQTYNGNTYLFHDSSSTMRLWVYYDGGWKVTYVQNSTNPSSAEKPTQLYMEEDNRQPQSLSFSASSATYDLSAPSLFVKPTLSTAIGTVTYSSSDTAIAEVDNSGNITGKKKGTVTITATATGNTEYRPGSASYTLVISNSSSTTPIWRKADAIEAGETYLIVSNGYALQNNGGSAAAVAVTVSDGVIEFDAPDNAIFTATASSSSFTLQNDGQYMQRGGSSGSYVPTFSSSQSSYYQWTYSSADEYVTAKGNSTYYVYYSTGNSKWSMSTSSGSSHMTALYKLDDGSNPGGGDDPEPTTFTYTKISGDANLVTGTYLIVDKTDTYLFNASGSNNGGYSNLGSTTGISKDGSTITLTETLATASEFVFTRSGDNLTIKQVGGTHAGQYMFANSSTSNTYIGFQASENNFTINVQTGTALIYFCTTKGNSNAEYLYKKSADSFFKLGQSGAPGGDDAGVYLYKKVENP